MADGRAKPATPPRAAPCSRSSVARSLDAIKRYEVLPEEIDEAILAAINVSLCLESEGDNHVAEGFNHDIVINGRAFARR
jgi:hypothetical protein